MAQVALDQQLLRQSRKSGNRSLEIALKEVEIIHKNQYVQRNAREWHEDDIPVCSCRLTDDDEFGCLEDCENRASLIECLASYCPCGDRCANQRMQRGDYPPTQILDCGDKGLGLFTTQFIAKHDLVGEYMGEIVTEREYFKRKVMYRHEKHRYMMALNNEEVIDATRKGGRWRFMNHSCDPNCNVEKWEVNGEERLGIFAVRDIEAGEELCFDYKFESFANTGTTCLCNSKKCRGLIGVNNNKPPQSQPSGVKHEAAPGGASNGNYSVWSHGSSSGSAQMRRRVLDPVVPSDMTSFTTTKAADQLLERMNRMQESRRLFPSRREMFQISTGRVFLKRNLRQLFEQQFRSLMVRKLLPLDGVSNRPVCPDRVNVRELLYGSATPLWQLRSKHARMKRLEHVVSHLESKKERLKLLKQGFIKQELPGPRRTRNTSSVIEISSDEDGEPKEVVWSPRHTRSYVKPKRTKAATSTPLDRVIKQEPTRRRQKQTAPPIPTTPMKQQQEAGVPLSSFPEKNADRVEQNPLEPLQSSPLEASSLTSSFATSEESTENDPQSSTVVPAKRNAVDHLEDNETKKPRMAPPPTPLPASTPRELSKQKSPSLVVFEQEPLGESSTLPDSTGDQGRELRRQAEQALVQETPLTQENQPTTTSVSRSASVKNETAKTLEGQKESIDTVKQPPPSPGTNKDKPTDKPAEPFHSQVLEPHVTKVSGLKRSFVSKATVRVHKKPKVVMPPPPKPQPAISAGEPPDRPKSPSTKISPRTRIKCTAMVKVKQKPEAILAAANVLNAFRRTPTKASPKGTTHTKLVAKKATPRSSAEKSLVAVRAPPKASTSASNGEELQVDPRQAPSLSQTRENDRVPPTDRDEKKADLTKEVHSATRGDTREPPAPPAAKLTASPRPKLTAWKETPRTAEESTRVSARTIVSESNAEELPHGSQQERPFGRPHKDNQETQLLEETFAARTNTKEIEAAAEANTSADPIAESRVLLSAAKACEAKGSKLTTRTETALTSMDSAPVATNAPRAEELQTDSWQLSRPCKDHERLPMDQQTVDSLASNDMKQIESITVHEVREKLVANQPARLLAAESFVSEAPDLRANKATPVEMSPVASDSPQAPTKTCIRESHGEYFQGGIQQAQPRPTSDMDNQGALASEQALKSSTSEDTKVVDSVPVILANEDVGVRPHVSRCAVRTRAFDATEAAQTCSKEKEADCSVSKSLVVGATPTGSSSEDVLAGLESSTTEDVVACLEAMDVDETVATDTTEANVRASQREDHSDEAERAGASADSSRIESSGGDENGSGSATADTMISNPVEGVESSAEDRKVDDLMDLPGPDPSRLDEAHSDVEAIPGLETDLGMSSCDVDVVVLTIDPSSSDDVSACFQMAGVTADPRDTGTNLESTPSTKDTPTSGPPVESSYANDRVACTEMVVAIASTTESQEPEGSENTDCDVAKDPEAMITGSPAAAFSSGIDRNHAEYPAATSGTQARGPSHSANLLRSSTMDQVDMLMTETPDEKDVAPRKPDSEQAADAFPSRAGQCADGSVTHASLTSAMTDTNLSSSQNAIARGTFSAHQDSTGSNDGRRDEREGDRPVSTSASEVEIAMATSELHASSVHNVERSASTATAPNEVVEDLKGADNKDSMIGASVPVAANEDVESCSVSPLSEGVATCVQVIQTKTPMDTSSALATDLKKSLLVSPLKHTDEKATGPSQGVLSMIDANEPSQQKASPSSSGDVAAKEAANETTRSTEEANTLDAPLPPPTAEPVSARAVREAGMVKVRDHELEEPRQEEKEVQFVDPSTSSLTPSSCQTSAMALESGLQDTPPQQEARVTIELHVEPNQEDRIESRKEHQSVEQEIAMEIPTTEDSDSDS